MKQKNFTLLELLIVVSILALIAGGVVMSVSGSYKKVNEEVIKHRASIVYDALVKFKKDMGFYPKQDQLALSEVVNPAPSTLIEDHTAWFNNTGNFNQLFERPIGAVNPDKWKWNIDSKRGWDGPYLNYGDYTVDDETFSAQFNGVNQPEYVISRDTIRTNAGFDKESALDSDSEVFFQLIEEEDPPASGNFVFKLVFTVFDQESGTKEYRQMLP
ncbi:MAG: type II secretion system GspH family protein [Lentisphaeraceae bacterium]|nr:type II secretion system GspH family protein [Lentisphaeraceae bacterium]